MSNFLCPFILKTRTTSKKPIEDNTNENSEIKEDYEFWFKQQEFFEKSQSNGMEWAKNQKFMSNDISVCGKKNFYSFNTFNVLWEFLAKFNNPHFHEVFVPNSIFPHHIYTNVFYDIDNVIVVPKNDSEEADDDLLSEQPRLNRQQVIEEKLKDTMELIEGINLSFVETIYNLLDYGQKPKLRVKILIQNASGLKKSTPTQNKTDLYKISFHVNLSFYLEDKGGHFVFQRIDDILIFIVFSLLKKANTQTIIQLEHYHSVDKQQVLDFSIYKTNRSLRCLFSTNYKDKKRKLIVESFQKYAVISDGIGSGYYDAIETISLFPIKDLKLSTNEKDIFFFSLNLKPIIWLEKVSSHKNSKSLSNNLNKDSLIYVYGELLDLTQKKDEISLDDKEEDITDIKEILNKAPTFLFATIRTCVYILTCLQSTSSTSINNNLFRNDLSNNMSLSDNVNVTIKFEATITQLMGLLEGWIDNALIKATDNQDSQSSSLSSSYFFGGSKFGLTYKTMFYQVHPGNLEQFKHVINLKSGKTKPQNRRDYSIITIDLDFLKNLCIDYFRILFTSTCKTCLIAGKTHQNNHVYYMVDLWGAPSGAWYQKCYDEMCADVTEQKMRLLPYKKNNDMIGDNYSPTDYLPKGKSDIYLIPKEDQIIFQSIKNNLINYVLFVSGFKDIDTLMMTNTPPVNNIKPTPVPSKISKNVTSVTSSALGDW